MIKTVYLDAPNVGASEKAYLGKAVDSGYVSSIGPFVTEFERKISGYLNAKCSVATQSGTAALHMALYELGIKDGDEVIVPALTFAATVNPVIYVRAKPVFADVDLKTFTIDPGDIEAKITRNTKAIIPVHVYGNPCNMDEILRIARRHKLYVIEDATESLGATYRGRQTGVFGDFGCLSFNGNKTITTGGGGMIVGNDKKKACHIRFLINQAREDRGGYYHPEIGFNYRMTNIEAALGLAQLKKLESFLSKKRIYNEIYKEELAEIDGVAFQQEYKHSQSSWWLTCIVFEREVDLPRIQNALKSKGIPTRRIFIPLAEFPPYKNPIKNFRNSCHIYGRGLCLPSSTLNSERDVRRICGIMKSLFEKELNK